MREKRTFAERTKVLKSNEVRKDKLLKNPKITRERRYTEHCMRKLYKGYKKDAYRANEFVKRIDKAIENEKQFCEDIGALEYSVGSNIGCLITELRQNRMPYQ